MRNGKKEGPIRQTVEILRFISNLAGKNHHDRVGFPASMKST
jgi:hypothetical protein